MEFLAEYAGFLARTVTVVVAIVMVLLVVAVLRQKGQRSAGHLSVRKLNDFYRELREHLEDSVLHKDQLKRQRKAEAKARAEAMGKVMTQRYGVPYRVDAHGAIFRVLIGPVAADQQASVLEKVRQGGLEQAFIVP